MMWYEDLDNVRKIYVDRLMSRNHISHNAYFGDIGEDTFNHAKIIFVDGWINNKDPFTGKLLIELECFKKYII